MRVMLWLPIISSHIPSHPIASPDIRMAVYFRFNARHAGQQQHEEVKGGMNPQQPPEKEA